MKTVKTHGVTHIFYPLFQCYIESRIICSRLLFLLSDLQSYLHATYYYNSPGFVSIVFAYLYLFIRPKRP